MNTPSRQYTMDAIINQALLCAQSGKGDVVTLITRPLYRAWLRRYPGHSRVAGTTTMEVLSDLWMCVTVPVACLPTI